MYAYFVCTYTRTRVGANPILRSPKMCFFLMVVLSSPIGCHNSTDRCNAAPQTRTRQLAKSVALKRTRHHIRKLSKKKRKKNAAFSSTHPGVPLTALLQKSSLTQKTISSLKIFALSKSCSSGPFAANALLTFTNIARLRIQTAVGSTVPPK